MRKIAYIFCILFVTPAIAESFLKAQSFPKTFQDTSFTERMEFKTADYDLYRPVYDKTTGNCIQGCAYPSLNITYEKQISDIDTQNALRVSLGYDLTPATLPVDTRNIVDAIGNKTGCFNRNNNIPSGQKAPFGKPLAVACAISSPYGPRILDGKQSFHDGIDFAVPTGTDVFAPADAVVIKVINDSTCGQGLKLKHEDGTQSIYCHLSKSFVRQGDNIGAGCKIAESGNTGHSTGPHLHYGLRNSAGNKIDPTPYINNITKKW